MLKKCCLKTNHFFVSTNVTRLMCTIGTTTTSDKPSYSIKHLRQTTSYLTSPTNDEVGVGLNPDPNLSPTVLTSNIHEYESNISNISDTMFNGMIDNVTATDAESIVKQLDGSFVSNLLAVEKSRCIHGYPRAHVRYPVTTKGSVDTVSGGFIRLACPMLVEAVDKLEMQHFDQQTEKKLNTLFSDYIPLPTPTIEGEQSDSNNNSNSNNNAVAARKRRNITNNLNMYDMKDGHGHGIGYFNRLVGSSPTLQANFHEVNKAHCDIRHRLVQLDRDGNKDSGTVGTGTDRPVQTKSKQAANEMAMQSGIAGVTQGKTNV